MGVSVTTNKTGLLKGQASGESGSMVGSRICLSRREQEGSPSHGESGFITRYGLPRIEYHFLLIISPAT